MGYYIEVPSNHNKAEQIIRMYGGAILPEAPKSVTELPAGCGLVCVVDNGIFEAAAYAFDDRELAAFSDPSDNRPKVWIAMDNARAKELSGYRERK